MRKFTHVDLLLLFMVILWGINFTVVKFSLREISPLSFNALRFPLGSLSVMLILKLRERDLRLQKGDFWPIVLLGIIGNTIYQILFIIGIDNTRAVNTSLILAVTPIFVTLLSTFFRHEKVNALAWTGVALSFSGVFLILEESAQTSIRLGTKTLKGDLLILVACVCWATYTVFSVPLLRKYSPLKLTAYTTLVGSLFFLLFSAKAVLRQAWSQVTLAAWGGLLYSCFGAIVLGYLIWYYGVQKIGNIRTAIYSNLVPVVALIVARIYLGEQISLLQGFGAGIILLGIYLTRLKSAGLIQPGSEFES